MPKRNIWWIDKGKKILASSLCGRKSHQVINIYPSVSGINAGGPEDGRQEMLSREGTLELGFEG